MGGCGENRPDFRFAGVHEAAINSHVWTNFAESNRLASSHRDRAGIQQRVPRTVHQLDLGGDGIRRDVDESAADVVVESDEYRRRYQVSREAGRGNREHSSKGKDRANHGGISLSAYDARVREAGWASMTCRMALRTPAIPAARRPFYAGAFKP